MWRSFRPLILMTAVSGILLLGLAEDSRNSYSPTYFGVQDGQMPEDPRHWRGGRFYNFPTWEVSQDLPNDVFTFARLRYNSGTWMNQRAKWMIDYPDSELNFSYRLNELTSLEVNPKSAIVDIDAEQMRHYPFIYMIEPGDIWLTDDEAAVMREYMLKGGFIMVDDFWGGYEWKNFYRALKQIFPDRDYVELELDHPIFHLEIKPQIPAVGLA